MEKASERRGELSWVPPQVMAQGYQAPIGAVARGLEVMVEDLVLEVVAGLVFALLSISRLTLTGQHFPLSYCYRRVIDVQRVTCITNDFKTDLYCRYRVWVKVMDRKIVYVMHPVEAQIVRVISANEWGVTTEF